MTLLLNCDVRLPAARAHSVMTYFGRSPTAWSPHDRVMMTKRGLRVLNRETLEGLCVSLHKRCALTTDDIELAGRRELEDYCWHLYQNQMLLMAARPSLRSRSAKGHLGNQNGNG